MPINKDLKRLVRARMKKTGEAYTTARTHLLKKPKSKTASKAAVTAAQNVDYAECFRRGIQVLSIAPVFAQPVAEMALGLALDLARGITRGDRLMREGRDQYGLAGNRDAFALRGATVGFIGCGNLGRALNLEPPTGRGVAEPWAGRPPDGGDAEAVVGPG